MYGASQFAQGQQKKDTTITEPSQKSDRIN
jgi:hypothetical protein